MIACCNAARFLKEDVNILAGELAAKIAVCSKEIAAMEKVALKTDQDLKDAERNLTSLINKVGCGHLMCRSRSREALRNVLVL